MNFAKQKYKALVATKLSIGIIYAKTLDDLNQKIDKIKAKYPYTKVTIYTRDDEAESTAFAQWRLIETKEQK